MVSPTSQFVGWESEPQTRGTLGLVWSCLATIFLCTWSTVHPNLPAINDSPYQIFWRRTLYVFGALLAPEFLACHAMAELRRARRLQLTTPQWPFKQCFFLAMGGFAIQCKSDPEGEPIHVTSDGFTDLVASGALSWPKVCIRDIDDRSKADWILVGHAAGGLSVTTLEHFTLGTVMCATVTYCALWSKPFDIRTPLILEIDAPLPALVSRVERVRFRGKGTETPLLLRATSILDVTVLLIFGGMHVLRWQFHFTTLSELWLWRASSLVCLASPLISYFSARIAWWLDPTARKKKVQLGSIAIVFGVPYVLCRLYMFVEMLVGLRNVPAGVYETPQWSAYFPSIS